MHAAHSEFRAGNNFCPDVQHEPEQETKSPSQEAEAFERPNAALLYTYHEIKRE